MNAAAKLDACTDAIRRFNADMGRTAFECLAEIVTALNGGDNERGALLLMREPEPPALASDENIARARDDYASYDINIDDDAEFSDCGDGAGWVQAWVYIGPTDDDGEQSND